MSHKITHTLQKYLPSRQSNLITNMSSSLVFVTVASYMKVEGFHTKCYDALYIADHKSNDCFGRVKCFLLIYDANMRILEMDIDTPIPIKGAWVTYCHSVYSRFGLLYQLMYSQYIKYS